MDGRGREGKTKRDVPININPEYLWNLFIKQDRICILSGLDIRIDNTEKYNTASVDRIDNTKGYMEGNVQWVHKDINMMKRVYNQDYFIYLCKKITENN